MVSEEVGCGPVSASQVLNGGVMAIDPLRKPEDEVDQVSCNCTAFVN